MKVDPGIPAGSPPAPLKRRKKSTASVRQAPVHAQLPQPVEAKDLPLAQPRAVAPSVIAEIERAGRAARIGSADMRREMTQLLDNIETLIPDPRAARAAAWVIRGEVRKLDVLDGFVSGYIKG